jgi:hypothetical protein
MKKMWNWFYQRVWVEGHFKLKLKILFLLLVLYLIVMVILIATGN